MTAKRPRAAGGSGSAARRPSSTGRRAPARRSPAPRRPARRTTPRRRTTRGSTAYRRRTPRLATTLGAALGTLLVAMLTGASWPVRIGLAVLAVAVVGGYLLWSGRRAPDPSPDPGPLSHSTPEPSPDPKDQR